MSLFKKSYDQDNSEYGRDAQLKKVLREVMHKDQKREWGLILKDEYGIVRANKSKSIKSRYRIMYKFAAAAAIISILVITGLSIYSNNKTPKSYALSYLESSQVLHPGVLKGISPEDQGQRLLAIKSFDEKLYEEAIQHFRSIESTNIEDEYYLSLALLYDGHYKESINSFQSIATKSDIYTQEINWFLSLALVLNNEHKEAITHLSMIKPNDWKYTETQHLIRLLSK